MKIFHIMICFCVILTAMAVPVSCYAAVKTRESMGFSGNVKSVTIKCYEDEIYYRFDSDGHLVQVYDERGRYPEERLYVYEKGRLVADYYKWAYRDLHLYTYDDEGRLSTKITHRSLPYLTFAPDGKVYYATPSSNPRLEEADLNEIIETYRKSEECYSMESFTYNTLGQLKRSVNKIYNYSPMSRAALYGHQNVDTTETAYQYDRQGRLIKDESREKCFLPNVRKLIYQYDSDGRLTYEKYISKDLRKDGLFGGMTIHTRHFRSSDGRLVKTWEYRDGDRDSLEVTEYVYDDGRLKEKWEFDLCLDPDFCGWKQDGYLESPNGKYVALRGKRDLSLYTYDDNGNIDAIERRLLRLRNGMTAPDDFREIDRSYFEIEEEPSFIEYEYTY